MAGDEAAPYGVLSPDESDIWHLVETSRAPRSLCGKLILYGARMRPWVETAEADRCGYCVSVARDPT
jgi:hypothetical protein